MTKPSVPLDERPRSGPYSGLNTNSARRFLRKQFEQAGLPDCDAEARDLVMAATGLSRAQMITEGTEFISPEAFDRLQDYSARRLSGEPADNILGWREFYGRRFDISPDVLSPRQETEEVTAKALAQISAMQAPHILDLGTGSGAIITTILCERADAVGTAADISKAALDMAKKNAAAYGVTDRLTFLQSDWFDNIEGQFDLIISNPPYIDSAAMAQLPREVLAFDPQISLHGGEDGLTPYRIIAAQAGQHLKPGGVLVFEIGFDQGRSVPDILRRAGFINAEMFRDIAGQPRIVTARASAGQTSQRAPDIIA